MHTYRFYKENGRWFVDIPEWAGDKDDLEMVFGADALLDYLSSNGNSTIVSFSTVDIDGGSRLSLDEPTGGDGGFYLNDGPGPRRIWLCGVTEWVFGFLPENIFYKRISI